MKTASRILGAAAFHAGYVVQDSPIYGAERRGAPMAALVRMARAPIRERGMVTQPDLVVVADDTLLGDPAVQALAGCDVDSVLLINSTKTESDVRQAGGVVTRRVCIADFTAAALEHTRALSGLSTALAVAAARLVGLAETDVETGLREELKGHVSPEQWQQNLALAQATYGLTRTWAPLHDRREVVAGPASPVVDVPFAPPRVAAPAVYARANTPERKTGNWRQFRPLLHRELCTRCWICFVRCPEAAISLDAQDYPAVDYDECKGCLLCVHECPTRAFTAEKEVR
jgi:pyruvate ferredoxin oxidoreductase gamma subunit